MKAYMKTSEAAYVLEATCVKSPVWTLEYTNALAWDSYCSSWHWKPSPNCLVHDVSVESCIQIARSSSLKCQCNCRRCLSFRRTWKERYFDSTLTKTRPGCLDRYLVWFIGPANTHVFSDVSTDFIFCDCFSSLLHKICMWDLRSHPHVIPM